MQNNTTTVKSHGPRIKCCRAEGVAQDILSSVSVPPAVRPRHADPSVRLRCGQSHPVRPAHRHPHHGHPRSCESHTYHLATPFTAVVTMSLLLVLYAFYGPFFCKVGLERSVQNLLSIINTNLKELN